MLRAAAILSASAMLALPAAADEAQVRQLYEALRMDDVLAIMRAEGLVHADELAEEMFAGRGGGTWDAAAKSIYATERMEDQVARDLVRSLADTDLGPLLDFFTSELGREIIALEIEAREALQDESVEEAVTDRAAELRQDGDPRIEMLDAFVEVNDLIDANVAGALNANYAFYTGLAEGGAFDGAPTEDQVVGDVWAQEPEIRAETLDWIYGYLNMAYRPLTDDELESYTDLGRSAEGRALNTAIFGAFDAMYVDISRALGEGAARFMAGQDI